MGRTVTLDHRAEGELMIMKRAMEDEDFRKALIDDPKAAIENEFGISIPEHVKIEVHVEKEDDPTWHMVVPAIAEKELSYKELDAISGGSVSQQDIDNANKTAEKTASVAGGAPSEAAGAADAVELAAG